MPRDRIIAVGLLTQHDIEVLGQGFSRLWPVDETPWGWIAGGIAGVLALLGGIVVARRRKKTARPRAAAAPTVPLLARLRQRFARKNAQKKATEPVLEEDAHDTSTQA